MLAVSIMTALTINLTPLLHAQDVASPPMAGKAAAKGRTMPYRGKITALDKTAKTISLAGKEKDRVFQVIAETRILKDGKPVLWEEVQVGEQVRGQARLVDQGNPELLSLYLGPKGEDVKDSRKQAGETK
jgi:hypothetical protein